LLLVPPLQVEAVLDAHVRPGDKFEVYCLMELFALGGDLRADVEALIVRRRPQPQQRVRSRG